MFHTGEKVRVKTMEEVLSTKSTINEEFFKDYGGKTATILHPVSPNVYEIEVDGVKKTVGDNSLKKALATETPQKLRRMM